MTERSGVLEDMEVQRTHVVCRADAPSHTESVQYSGAFRSAGYDNSLRLNDLQKNLRVEVKSLTEDDIEFDIIGIDAAIANAFRRILISEVPTMAIEKVLVKDNTSVIQDEVLAHRIGLVPIQADPRLFTEKTDEDVATEKNTIVFSLAVKCVKAKDRVINTSVKSDQLVWQPQGSSYMMNEDSLDFEQHKLYTSFSCSQDSIPTFKKDPIRPKYDNILLAKLRPGQCIELEAHAVKGVGKTHAKWSPVATASYRMLPEVILKEEIEDERADELVKKCPMDVFDIEDIMGGKRATVARPRKCTLCRECIRGDGWDKRIELRRVKDHFIFSVESTGALPPETLFTEATKILAEKCQRIYNELS